MSMTVHEIRRALHDVDGLSAQIDRIARLVKKAGSHGVAVGDEQLADKERAEVVSALGLYAERLEEQRQKIEAELEGRA